MGGVSQTHLNVWEPLLEPPGSRQEQPQVPLQRDPGETE